MVDFADLRNKNIAILWFGREGKSTLKFLMDQKIHFSNITILDAKDDLDNPDAIHAITWSKYLQDLDKYDIIFKSSGVPITTELVHVKEKIVTQVQLFFDNYPGKVIAVTASKGKSTIVSLIYALLKNAGYNVKLVGNIGVPILDEIDICPPFKTDGDPEFCPVRENDFVVIELSSYMLHDLRKKNFISILGTIFPEHLDRHGSFDNYVGAKLNILKGSEINIVNHETLQRFDLDKAYTNLIPYDQGSAYARMDGHFTLGDKMIFSVDDRKIPGDHNLENITAVVALADTLKIPMEILHTTVREFQWLPHRLQEVGEYGGIRWIDDAISTTPESTIEALKTYGDQIDTIFLGWTDRGYQFDELAKYIHQSKIRNIVIFPDSWERILESLQRSNVLSSTKEDPTLPHLIQTSSMQEAVQFAYEHTEKWKICLLSTASPSYSLWKDFEEKGDLFQKYIKEIT